MNNQEKKMRLEAAVDSLRLRFGASAVVQLGDRREEIAHLSSGFPALDSALGIGGFPRGQISHLSGVPTSGATTIALKSLAQASASGMQGAIGYIDMTAAFDADYAARCGIDVDNLVLVTPRTMKQAIQSIVPLLPDAIALVLNLPPDRPTAIASREISQLAAQFRQSTCALIIIEQAPSAAITGVASVQLQVQRVRWLRRRGDISGYRTAVTIVRNPHGATGKTVNITIGFSSTVAGDGV